MSETPLVMARLERIRKVLAMRPVQIKPGFTLAYVIELEDHIRWLTEKDCILRALHEVLEENQRLKGKG